MKRTPLNLLVDLLAAVGVLLMIATGYILRFPLPPTTNRTHELWGMSRHEWGTLHSWASLGLLAVLFIHLLLHWEWIFATVRRRFTSARTAPDQRFHAGIITVVVLLVLGALFAGAAQIGVRKLETPRHPLRELPESTGKPSEPALPRGVDFWRDVRPLFEVSCIGCHGPKKQSANFRVDRREDFFAAGKGTPLVVPRDPNASRLLAIVSGEVKEMKDADSHRLRPDEIGLLKAWINAGADWPEKDSTSKSADGGSQP